MKIYYAYIGVSIRLSLKLQIKKIMSTIFFTKFKCLLGELALATRGGRLIGWKDAREYARLSLHFVRNKLTLLK